MNNGEICVSVCAENADELIKQIYQAEEFADVIEIRFDCLKESEFDLALQKVSQLNFRKPFLATFRPIGAFEDFTFSAFVSELTKNATNDEVKKRIARLESRINNWKPIFSLNNINFLDFELDLFLGLTSTNFFDNKLLENHQIIVSEHNFEKVPDELEEIYEAMSSAEEYDLKCDIIKIAVQPNDIADSISIWKLLERAKQENTRFIPIAMGEAGKWTRILGLAHGAFMTYASLDSGNETAPGQVSAKDLIEVYRAKELDQNTDVYGIIGNPVSHSVSPEMQNAAFKFHDLNAVYIPFEVKNLDEFITRMVKPATREIDLNFRGFSVTIPHKQNIIKHLDFIDETAQKIGAVNTVKIVDGKLHGYNTDAQGFIEPLKNVYGDLKDANVAIFGAGGSARACVYALKNEGANVTIFARDSSKAQSLADKFEIELKDLSKFKNQKSKINCDILVNTTPLGMKGKFEGETPIIAEQFKDVKLVYDLVFNPFQTKFMNEADKANVPKIAGMAMLVAQGMAQFKIWTGKSAPMKEMSQAVLQKLS